MDAIQQLANLYKLIALATLDRLSTLIESFNEIFFNSDMFLDMAVQIRFADSQSLLNHPRW